MPRYSDHDAYVDPVSGVLKNRLGITDVALLESTEADLVAIRSSELVRRPLTGDFDLRHLRAIHRYLFGDLYEWAGELRTVDISKNDNFFAHHAHLENAAADIFMKLRAENYLRGLDAERFCSRAAYYLGEINALHPFREGNGRTQREFMSHLAHVNGYYIAWEVVVPEEWMQASIESFRRKTGRLGAILRRTLRPSDP